MSYIRCLSNPEGLYIYSSSEGVMVHHCLKKPWASSGTGQLDQTMVINEKDFFRVCHLWDHGPKAYFGPVASGKLKVFEQDVFEKDGSPVPKDFDFLDKFNRNKRSHYVIRLQYGKHYIMLWRVTWQYVVANVVGRRAEHFKCRYCHTRKQR